MNELLERLGLTKEQLFEIENCLLEYRLTKDFRDDFSKVSKTNPELAKKLIEKGPILYNFLDEELKKNQEFIELAIKSQEKKWDANPITDAKMEKSMNVLDFYVSVIKSDNKVKFIKENFSNLDKETLNRLIEDIIIYEYIEEKTFEVLNFYKETVLADDNLLNNIILILGLKGFLAEYKDDYDFISRIVELRGEYLLLASESLKNDRYLITKAINNEPWVAFLLDLSFDDILFKEAIAIIKEHKHEYLYLGFLEE